MSNKLIIQNFIKTIAFFLIQVAQHIKSWVLRQSDFKKLEKKMAEKKKPKDKQGKQAPAEDDADKVEDATSEDEPEGSLGSLSEPDSDTIISIHDSADDDDAYIDLFSI